MTSVHDPITLRFRADEKRFDMDSPSGVRFELLKKRLDKARIKGTEERIRAWLESLDPEDMGNYEM